ncbi:MAG: DUF1080 domain-containing protein [Bacteroidota bacterium]
MILKDIVSIPVLLLSIYLFSSCGQSGEHKLFNGESLEGWEGSRTIFRVENGAIVGGSLTKPIEESQYLCTDQKYENFELKLAAKFITDDLQVNGGISFRAKRVADSHEVMGYQADIGYVDTRIVSQFSDFTPQDSSDIYPLWGSLVDENRPILSRYPRPDIFPVIFYKVVDRELIDGVVDAKDWNEIHIIANGPDIEISINGVSTAQFTEQGNVPKNGCICLQTHSGKPFEVWYKDIVLTHLE